MPQDGGAFPKKSQAKRSVHVEPIRVIRVIRVIMVIRVIRVMEPRQGLSTYAVGTLEQGAHERGMICRRGRAGSEQQGRAFCVEPQRVDVADFPNIFQVVALVRRRLMQVCTKRCHHAAGQLSFSFVLHDFALKNREIHRIRGY